MATAFYDHYRKVPQSIWRWPNFTPKEIASKGDGSIMIDFFAMDTLQAARTIAGRPFIIHSAYRDELHNAMIGGAPRSYHTEGRAFDIGLDGFGRQELADILKDAGFSGFGLNYNTFIHADTGRRRVW